MLYQIRMKVIVSDKHTSITVRNELRRNKAS